MHHEGDPHEAEHGSLMQEALRNQADLTDASSDCIETYHADVTCQARNVVTTKDSHSSLYLLRNLALPGSVLDIPNIRTCCECSHDVPEIHLQSLELTG